MQRACTAVRSITASLVLAMFALPTLPVTVSAQTSGEIQVLVAPLEVGSGVDGRFGERVADEVRKALEGFSGMSPLDKREVEKTVKDFGLDPKELTAIEWRQLAGRMGAQLVMVGTAQAATGGVLVDADFLDPRSGDELPVDEFTVASDKEHKEAATKIMAQVEVGVEYSKAVVFCGDYLGSNALDDARRNCEAALAINPNSTRALYLRGRINMESEMWSEAAADLERVVEESPSNTDALQSLAYTHAQLGNNQRSFELYKEYLTFNPEDADVRLKIAFDLASAQAYEEAIGILREGVERDDSNATFWEYLGHFALAKGTATSPAGETGEAGENGESPVSDPAAVRMAVEAYDNVLRLKGDDTDPTILKNVISAHLELGDLEAALDFSNRALAAIKDAPEAEPEGEGEEAAEPPMSREELLAQIHSQRADIFKERGDFATAVAEMDEVLRLDPDYQRAHFKRGDIRLLSGDKEGAVSDFRMAAQQGDDVDQIAHNLFARGYQDYFQRGQFTEAIDLFDTALELAENADTKRQVHFFAGYGYYQMGTAIDKSNEANEACQPARRALNAFQNVLPHINLAGGYQSDSQASIRDAVDVQLYRQEQIIRKSCG